MKGHSAEFVAKQITDTLNLASCTTICKWSHDTKTYRYIYYILPPSHIISHPFLKIAGPQYMSFYKIYA